MKKKKMKMKDVRVDLTYYVDLEKEAQFVVRVPDCLTTAAIEGILMVLPAMRSLLELDAEEDGYDGDNVQRHYDVTVSDDPVDPNESPDLTYE